MAETGDVSFEMKRPEVIGTDQTIRTNGKMLQTMVSYKTFPAVSCLLPHPQLFFISGNCHLNFTYMCFNFTCMIEADQHFM